MAEVRELLGGRIDCWVNNAGASGSFQARCWLAVWGCRQEPCPGFACESAWCCRPSRPPSPAWVPLQSLLDQPPEQVQRVVATNLLGSLLATRAAMAAMGRQPGGGTVFNMEGAGSDGSPTPQARRAAAWGRLVCCATPCTCESAGGHRQAQGAPRSIRLAVLSLPLCSTPRTVQPRPPWPSCSRRCSARPPPCPTCASTTSPQASRAAGLAGTRPCSNRAVGWW